MSFGESRFNGIVALLHNGFHVVWRLDWVVDGESDFAGIDWMSLFWHDVERAVNADRHNGAVEVGGELKGTALEALQFAVDAK